MRLSQEECQLICKTLQSVDPNAKTYLFGSRVHDHYKGGDLDLLCLSNTIDRKTTRQIKRRILDQIGDQKLDLLVKSNVNSPFVKMILEHAILIS